tara:strand:+ start:330 stop:1112 length:783 start_codon:yes stop_codon:yes gene_type:complete
MFGQEYIEIIKTDINIRMLPTTASPIVGHAFKGELYILNGEKPKWYSVLLPSGESRWIYKRLAQKITTIDSIPDTLDMLSIQEELKIASDNAHKDANEEKIKNLNKIEINNILFDRYNLMVLQNHKISPVHYKKIIDYTPPPIKDITELVGEYLVSVTHIEYDLFKIDFFNFYIETRRCFKLGSSLDAMIYMYYQGEDFIQKLCFEDGYGKGFNNCYNIKNIYSSVLQQANLIAVTKDGKIKKTDLILQETILNLPESKY